MKTLIFSLVALLCFFSSISNAQKLSKRQQAKLAACKGQIKHVSGIIKDEMGPLVQATVVIAGTSKGTTTDFDGYFELDVPVGSHITISYVGLGAQNFYVGPDYDDGRSLAENIVNASKTKKPADSTQKKSQKPKVYWHEIPSDESKTFSPYFFVHSDEPKIDRLPLKATSATVNIAGVIADVRIKQVYVNEGNRPIEAEYIFPGSINAAVYGMEMQVGERVLKAKIKKKQEAKQIYETAKAEGKTASLLDQKRPNVFKMSVANILPGDTISVVISYTEMLNATNGIYEFAYPSVVGPRFSQDPLANVENTSPDWNKNPYVSSDGSEELIDFSLDVNINSPIPIKQLRSKSHKIDIDYRSATNAGISIVDEAGDEGNRDFVLSYMLRDAQVQSGLISYEGTDENYFAYILEPPKDVAIEQVAKREYIFVIDVSGSMSGYPLETAKKLMGDIFKSLKPDERFNIMTFSGGSSWYAEKSVRATAVNKTAALNFVLNYNGSGGTLLLNALENALAYEKPKGYSRSFVVITDGYVSVEKQAYSYIRDNLNEANLFSVGIGSSVNRYIIDGMAHAGKAEPFYVLGYGDSKAEALKISKAIKSPVLADIDIQFEGVEVYDVEPRKVPDLFSERTMVVFGKYKNNNGGSITIRGKAGENDYVKRASFDSVQSEQNSALRYLWARNKIKYYDDYAMYYEAGDYEKQGIITELGLKYNLLTQYTSFVAVDTVVRSMRPNTTVRQPLPMPKHVSAKALSSAGNVFTLKVDSKELKEAVVIGYGKLKKEDLTGAITQVSGQDISSMPVIGVDQSLQGKAAGVQVTNSSGAPGAGVHINIRGTSSVTGNGPLYVVDGVPVGTDISNIAPGDIQNISVMKDASAASIYGSRGANGVILVTTKEGSEKGQKMKVDFESNYGVLNAQKNHFTDNMASGLQKASVFNNKVGLQASTGNFRLNMATSSKQLKGLVEGSAADNYAMRLNFNWHAGRFSTDIKTNLFYNESENIYNNSYLSSHYYYHAMGAGEPFQSSDDEKGKMASGKLSYSVNKSIKLSNTFSAMGNNHIWGALENDRYSENYTLYSNLLALKIDDKAIFNTLPMIKISSLSAYSFEQENFRYAAEDLYADTIIRQNQNFLQALKFDLTDMFVLDAKANMKLIGEDVAFDKSLAGLFRIHNTKWFKTTVAFRQVNECALRLKYSDSYAQKQITGLYSSNSAPEVSLPLYDQPGLYDLGHNLPELNLVRTNGWNLGLDLAFMKNKILFTAEVYKNKTWNNLALIENGNSYAFANAFDGENRGWEMTLTYRKYEGDFHYNINAIFSEMNSRVNNIYQGDELLFLSFADAKVMAKEGDDYASVYTSNENGDAVKLGSIAPDFETGATVNFDYKGFDLSVQAMFRNGGLLLDYTKEIMNGSDLESVSANDIATDNSFLSINNIRLGYSLPRRIARKLHMRNCRFGLFADSPFTFSANKNANNQANINSKAHGQGIDFFGDPQQSIFGAEIQLHF